MKVIPIWERFAVIIEVALVSMLIFKILTLLMVNYIPPALFYYGILLVHYLVILICGFWTGWKIRVDGWLYAIIAYGVFYGFRQMFNVYYPLPLANNLKLLMFIPALALLMVGAVFGEISAEKRENLKESL